MERGHSVWVKDKAAKTSSTQDIWISGIVQEKIMGSDGQLILKVLTRDADVLAFRIPKGENESFEVKFRNQTDLEEIDDLNTLAHLNEPEIINSLQYRFFRNAQIFTFTGRILLALNPSGVIQPGVSSQKLIQRYADNLRRKSDLLFDTISLESSNQKSSVLISGESGSGKTETANMILKCIAGRNHSHSNPWFQKVLSANLVLESLGNAKTANSENSSRFGKVIDLAFSSDGVIISCQFRTYLLESSRTVSQQQFERNFNIFYQFLAGAAAEENSDRRNLRPASFYNYSSQGGEQFAIANHKEDRAKFASFMSNATALGFTQSELCCLLDLVMAILELGEIIFGECEAGECRILDEVDLLGPLQCASSLLGLSPTSLTELLTVKSIAAPNGEIIRKSLSVAQASSVRDTVAKTLYRSMFEWVVDSLNDKLRRPDEQSTNSVLLVDIFGFDSFEKNCLEQLCINYANETLQQLFNYHIFKQEVELYESEGLSFRDFTFADNQANIDLIGNGIFSTLDDQCKLPNPTDKRFFGVLCTKMASNPLFSSNHHQQLNLLFTVTHFAGVVQYTADGIIDRNIDNLPAETSRVFAVSRNSVLNAMCVSARNILQSPLAGGVAYQRRRLMSVSVSDVISPSSALSASPFASSVASPTSASTTSVKLQGRTAPSFVSQVKSDLSWVVSEVRHTVPHYVRCLCPFSRYKQPPQKQKLTKFDHQSMVEQLKYSGVFEAIRIARTGFHSKFTFLDYYNRYRAIVRTVQPSEAYRFPRIMDDAETAKLQVAALIKVVFTYKPDAFQVVERSGAVLLPTVPFKKGCIQLGHTYVFTKRLEHENMELLRAYALKVDATIVQKHICGWYRRTHFKKIKESTSIVQRYARGFLIRLFLRRTRLLIVAVVRIQRNFRKRKFHRSIARLQGLYRAKLARRQFALLKKENLKLLDVYGPLLVARNMRTKRRMGKVTKLSEPVVIQNPIEEKLLRYNKIERDLIERVTLMVSGVRLPGAFQLPAMEYSALVRALQAHVRLLHGCSLRKSLKKVLNRLKPAHFLLRTRALTQNSVVGRTLGPTLWVQIGYALDKSCLGIAIKEEHGLFAKIRNLVEELAHVEDECTQELTSIDNRIQSLRYEMNQNSKATNNDPAMKGLLEALDQGTQLIHFLESVLFMLRKYYEAFVKKLCKDIGPGSYFRQLCNSEAEYVRRVILVVRQFKRGTVKMFQQSGERKEFYNFAGFLAKLESKGKQDLMTVDNQRQFEFDKLRECEFGLITKIRDLEEKKMGAQKEPLAFTELDGIAYERAPQDPAVSFAINSFLSVLQNENSPLSWLIKVGAGIHMHGQSYYYQATLGLIRKSLNDVLYDPIAVERLEMLSFTAALVTSCVFGLTSIQPKNILVKPLSTKEEDPIQIVGFHIDDKIANQFANCTNSTRKAFSMQNISALFCLPQMDEPVNVKFLSMIAQPGSCEEIICAWLCDLHMQNERYYILQQRGFTAADLQQLSVPIRLHRNLSFVALLRLQLITNLHKNKQCHTGTDGLLTHDEIVSTFFAELNFVFHELRNGSDFAEGVGVEGLASYAYVYHKAQERAALSTDERKRTPEPQFPFDSVRHNSNPSINSGTSPSNGCALRLRASVVRNSIGNGNNSSLDVTSSVVNTAREALADDDSETEKDNGSIFEKKSLEGTEQAGEEVVDVEVYHENITHYEYDYNAEEVNNDCSNGEDNEDDLDFEVNDDTFNDFEEETELDYIYRDVDHDIIGRNARSTFNADTGFDYDTFTADGFCHNDARDTFKERGMASGENELRLIKFESSKKKPSLSPKRKIITLVPLEDDEVDLYATFEDPDQAKDTIEPVELPFKQYESFTKRMKSKKEKDRWILELTKRAFDPFAGTASTTARQDTISVEEEAFHFLRRLDWRKLAESTSREQSVDVCVKIGKYLSFLPSLWLNFITDWQLLALFRTWLHGCLISCEGFREQVQMPLLVREIILHFSSMEELNRVKDWPVLARLHRRLRLDVKFAVSTAFPPGTLQNANRAVLRPDMQLDELQYDLYAYNPCSWDDDNGKDDDDEEDDTDFQQLLAKDPKLAENLALRKRLLSVVFGCTNLMAEDDIDRLERDVSILKKIIDEVCFEAEETDLSPGLLKSFGELLLEYPGLAEIGTTIAQRGKYRRDKSFIHLLVNHPLIERFENCILAILHAHPEVLLLLDKERGLLVCDALRRLSDKKHASQCKFRLLAQFVNFAAEPAHRYFQTLAVDSGLAVTTTSSSNRGIFTTYRGEEELIVLAAHFDFPTTSRELRQRQFDLSKRDTLRRQPLLLRLFVEEMRGIDEARRTQAVHCYKLLARAIKERVLSCEITAQQSEDLLWGMLGLDLRIDFTSNLLHIQRLTEERDMQRRIRHKCKLTDQMWNDSVIIQDLQEHWTATVMAGRIALTLDLSTPLPKSATGSGASVPLTVDVYSFDPVPQKQSQELKKEESVPNIICRKQSITTTSSSPRRQGTSSLTTTVTVTSAAAKYRRSLQPPQQRLSQSQPIQQQQLGQHSKQPEKFPSENQQYRPYQFRISSQQNVNEENSPSTSPVVPGSPRNNIKRRSLSTAAVNVLSMDDLTADLATSEHKASSDSDPIQFSSEDQRTTAIVHQSALHSNTDKLPADKSSIPLRAKLSKMQILKTTATKTADSAAKDA